MKLTKEVREETNKKHLNDFILSFAMPKEKITETIIGKHGLTSQVKAKSKKGKQQFKYQEILRR